MALSVLVQIPLTPKNSSIEARFTAAVIRRRRRNIFQTQVRRRRLQRRHTQASLNSRDLKLVKMNFSHRDGWNEDDSVAIAVADSHLKRKL